MAASKVVTVIVYGRKFVSNMSGDGMYLSKTEQLHIVENKLQRQQRVY